jgi:hypothetical protein
MREFSPICPPRQVIRKLLTKNSDLASAMREFWPQLSDLFETDDGSLPDIFVENLSDDQVRTIYHWIRTLGDIYCEHGDPTLWDREQQSAVLIKSLDDPAQLVIDGRVEPFRHGLTQFSLSGVRLPQLTVAVSPNEIEFDYRMGSEWGPSQVAALFDFLWTIQQMAPPAKISHSHEGESKRTPSFTDAWGEFTRDKSSA